MMRFYDVLYILLALILLVRLAIAIIYTHLVIHPDTLKNDTFYEHKSLNSKLLIILSYYYTSDSFVIVFSY